MWAIFEALLAKLRVHLKIPPEAAVLLAHDDTWFKSGKDGFVLASTGIYCRDMLEKPVFTFWQDFVRLDLKYTGEAPIKIYLSDESVICYFKVKSLG